MYLLQLALSIFISQLIRDISFLKARNETHAGSGQTTCNLQPTQPIYLSCNHTQPIFFSCFTCLSCVEILKKPVCIMKAVALSFLRISAYPIGTYFAFPTNTKFKRLT